MYKNYREITNIGPFLYFNKNAFRVEELFKLVEEELNADQGGGSFNHNLISTQTGKLPRETTFESCPLEPNGWPKTEAVIDFAKKLEEKEKKEVIEEEEAEVSRGHCQGDCHRIKSANHNVVHLILSNMMS